MATSSQPDRKEDTNSARRARLDALLDEALEGSFPASDPVAISFDLPERAVPSRKLSDKE